MTSLIKENGEIVCDTKQILNEQFCFYQKLYSSDPQVSFDYTNKTNVMLSDEVSETLEGKFLMEELQMAVKGMKRNRSPGCDGLPIELYICFWPRLKTILLNAFNEAYEEGELHQSALRRIITLIPKKGKDPRFVKNMSPITLLNTDYKLVEKILANQLKPALTLLIDEDQKGFMAPRNIACNIRRVLDLIDYTEENDIPGVVISMDFQKCFDRIEVSALLNSMSYFRIGTSFQRWTKIIYTKPVATVLNNSYFSPYFKVSHSVKQGGPCSAYFFLLIVEVLAIELRQNSRIQGLRFGKIQRILGQFADNMDLYLWGQEATINEALQTITHFEKRSGFKVSYEKTTLYRIGSLHKTKAELYTKRKIKNEDFSINILGVEVCHNQQDICQLNYHQMFDKIHGILKLWSA